MIVTMAAGRKPYDFPIRGEHHLDPLLENGGICSANTDMYSIRLMMKRIYDASEMYRCEVIKKCAELLMAHQRNKFDTKDLLQKNCDCCNGKFEDKSNDPCEEAFESSGSQVEC